MIGGFIGNTIGGRLAVESDVLQTVTANASVTASLTTNTIFAQMINAGVDLAFAFGATSIGKNVVATVGLSVSAAKAVAFAVTAAVDLAAVTIKSAGKFLIGIGVDLTVHVSSGLAVLITASITAAASMTRKIGKKVSVALDLITLVLRKLRPDSIKASISAGSARSTISRR